jgi:hypothetical protein
MVAHHIKTLAPYGEPANRLCRSYLGACLVQTRNKRTNTKPAHPYQHRNQHKSQRSDPCATIYSPTAGPDQSAKKEELASKTENTRA